MATKDQERKELHPAEILKLEAEAAAATALAGKHAAEERKFKAEALQAEIDVAIENIELDRENEKRARETSSFRHQRIYNFVEAVKADSCKKCMDELNYWSQVDPGCSIEVMFDSPGGSVFDGLALYDYIQELRRKGHHVTTSTRGMAASMGGILLQAGDTRVAGAEAWILIHEVSTIAGGKIGEIEDEVDLVKRIQERVLDIFAARSSLTKRTLRTKWRRRDWWIDSEEALKLGLVDEIR